MFCPTDRSYLNIWLQIRDFVWQCRVGFISNLWVGSVNINLLGSTILLARICRTPRSTTAGLLRFCCLALGGVFTRTTCVGSVSAVREKKPTTIGVFNLKSTGHSKTKPLILKCLFWSVLPVEQTTCWAEKYGLFPWTPSRLWSYFLLRLLWFWDCRWSEVPLCSWRLHWVFSTHITMHQAGGQHCTMRSGYSVYSIYNTALELAIWFGTRTLIRLFDWLVTNETPGRQWFV